MFHTKLRAKLYFVVLAILLFSSYRLRGLDDWQPVTQGDLKMTVDPSHLVDAIILYHEEVSDDNKHHRFVYKRLKIFTDKGKDRGSVEIPFDAAQTHVTDIKARTIAPDGTITPFTGKAFDSTLIKGHGVKYLAKTFTLPNVQTGSIIEWKYMEYWDENVVYAPHWTVQEELPQKKAKFTFIPLFQSGHYVQDSRGDIKDRVYYNLIGMPPNTAIKEAANNRMELELSDLPAFEEEDFSPPPRVLKMRVNFYYGSSKMDKPQEFWKSEGKYWSKEADKFIGDSSAVAAAASQVIGPSDTPDQKVHKIYAQVQKMKNLNYDREEGSIEEMVAKDSKEKRTLADVLRKNEGYRDELARLFVAMVRSVKIPAYLMRVSDRDENFFQPNIPMFSQLTSEIAIVPMADGKEVFLDPGTRFCPFGLLAWQHNGTQGIRQTAGGTELVPTPNANYKDAISKRVARLTLAADGSAHGRIMVAWAGEEGLVHRLSGFKTDAEGRKKELENEIQTMLPNGTTVQLDSVTGWDNPESQLTASFTVEIPSFASSAGRRMLVPTNLFQSQNVQPFAHGERKSPVYFNYPYYKMDDVQVVFPATLHVENLPQTQPVKTDYSVYKMERGVKANTLTFNRDFGIAGIVFTQKDYAELRKFFAGVSTGDSEQVVLTAAQ